MFEFFILLQNLAIKELPTFPSTNSFEKTPVTFVLLKSRLMNLLINALQVETDPQNTHMLLGKLIKSKNCDCLWFISRVFSLNIYSY